MTARRLAPALAAAGIGALVLSGCVAKSDVAADTIASAIHDLTEAMVVGTASDASKRRMLRKHARELVALHDELDAKEIFAQHSVVVAEGNGEVRKLVDPGGNVREG